MAGIRTYGEYPANWNDIAREVKEAARWRCDGRGAVELEPGERSAGLMGFELVYYAGTIRADCSEPRRCVRGRLLRAFAAMLDERLDAIYGVEQEAAA